MTPLYSQISKCHHLKNPSRVGIDGTAESECDRCSSKGLFTRERNTKSVVVSTTDSCQVPTQDMGIKPGVPCTDKSMFCDLSVLSFIGSMHSTLDLSRLASNGSLSWLVCCRTYSSCQVRHSSAALNLTYISRHSHVTTSPSSSSSELTATLASA